MLKVENVTGGYLNLPVLKRISFEVKNGEMVGLIGLNGAGKSTTINEIIGFLIPYEGTISIDGLTLAKDQKNYRQKIGFIPETPSLYEELTLKEHIETVAMAYDIEIELAFKRAEKLLKQFRLKDKLDWFPTNFSKGMKQKVMIICAFIVDPTLFIIDEPFLGLDPQAIEDLTQLMADEKAKGKAILMTTHVLDAAEKMCDRFVILHQGEVHAFGSLIELQEKFAMPNARLTDIYMMLTKEV
ncbi:ABC transporter ATP-binding protein [Streptococcus marimammalium]|uniref:ABC transporter ATP-binding protein n=1 Tax=Streptococcus marimammalium TaxID=269666 RepID=UPI00036ED1A3|nr:ABC transporter ATP-binding protein [Streptococcus marimammalium]